MNIREREQKRYDYIYSPEFNKKRYGHANYAQRVYDMIDKLKIKSILDVGCGGGEFCKRCVSKGIKTYGMDISSEPEIDDRVTWIKGIAQKIPLKDKSVEFVSAFDMLEHLPPEDLHIALSEFKRVATRGMILSFSYIRASEVMGENLHLIIEPKEWWIKQVIKYGHLAMINRKSKDFGFLFFDKNEIEKVKK